MGLKLICDNCGKDMGDVESRDAKHVQKWDGAICDTCEKLIMDNITAINTEADNAIKAIQSLRAKRVAALEEVSTKGFSGGRE